MISFSPLTKLSGHLPRLVTGLTLLALLITALIVGGLPLRLLAGLAATIALVEFYCLFWPRWDKWWIKLLGVGFCLLQFTAAIGRDPAGAAVVCAAVLPVAFVAAALAFLFDYGRGNEAASMQEYALLPLGLLYVAVPLLLALTFSAKEQALLMLAAIASDTAAYYAGCSFGKHKIWPRISPKKSWQGSLGGMAACVAVTTLFGAFCIIEVRYWHLNLSATPSIAHWIILGVIFNVAAQLGDFFESALKRATNVKDSSMLLPGHGGVLDRIDSVLFLALAYSFIYYGRILF